MNNVRGFTLVELMIVVAIIGILSSIALSTYLDYRLRAEGGAALAQASALKTCVLEELQSGSGNPEACDLDGPGVGLTDVSNLGVITSSSQEGNVTVTLTLNNLVWSCSTNTSVRVPGCNS